MLRPQNSVVFKWAAELQRGPTRLEDDPRSGIINFKVHLVSVMRTAIFLFLYVSLIIIPLSQFSN